jgi:uncharacterized protein (TIGR02118 family)
VIHALALLVRRPDLSRAAFRDHYERVHAPLAAPHLGGLRRYVRNHVLESYGEHEPEFDVISEFAYDDAESLVAVGEMLANSAAGAALRRDELRFMDRSRNVHFPVERATPVAERGTPPPAGATKLALLTGVAAPGPAPGELAATADALEPLLERAAAAVRWTVVPPASQPLPWAAVAFLWLRPGASARETANAYRPRGRRVLRLVVEECATPLDAP